MPTINDATVVNSAYDTSGNGGRKLVRLSNGWHVAVTKTTDYFYFFVDKQDGVGFKPLCHLYATNIDNADIAITSNGTKVYAFSGANTTVTIFHFFDAINVPNQNIYGVAPYYSGSTISSESALGNVSLAINDTGTELHATWASKNATYPNSFNIRYAKGTINGDGSVTWGAVVQVSKVNTSGQNAQNPSVVVKDGVPLIFVEYHGSSIDFNITVLKETGLTTYTQFNWTATHIRLGGTYAQSYPSAIFVPQSVNGLANGRIWVAWDGTDATDTKNNIRVSFSDDGGVAWSAMQKLTSGSVDYRSHPSLAANKNNELFVLYQISGSVGDVCQIKYNGSWGSEQKIIDMTTTVTNGATQLPYPSSLLDLSVNFTEPLFIYRNRDTAKVGFYGTWTVTTISVTPGSIGTKTDKSNVLTYAITTDGVMSTITEKVNGVTVGTKTATSGQSLIAGLSQAQWDAVRFGKYADVTGGKNTLTVEMGTEKWTYTFDKRLATTDDILSAVKAEQDVSNVFLPAVKSKLASAISAKGGTATGSDSWDALESAVSGIAVKKWASGTATSSAGTSSFTTGSGGSQSTYVLTVTGLSFVPSKIIIRNTGGNEDYHVTYDSALQTVPISRVQSRLATAVAMTFKLTGPTFVNGTSFAMPALAASTLYEWYAIE